MIQSVPSYSVTKIVRTIKSLIAREVFVQCPEIKKQLWGGGFWGKGYYVNTVGQQGTEKKIAQYVKNQGIENEYEKRLSVDNLMLHYEYIKTQKELMIKK